MYTYMLLCPKNPFFETIRMNFNTISMLGTNMYYIGDLRGGTPRSGEPPLDEPAWFGVIL